MFKHAGVTCSKCCPAQTEAGAVRFQGMTTAVFSAQKQHCFLVCLAVRCLCTSSLRPWLAPTRADRRGSSISTPSPSNTCHRQQVEILGTTTKVHVEMASASEDIAPCHSVTYKSGECERQRPRHTASQSPIACTFACATACTWCMQQVCGCAPWRRACGRACRTASAAAPPLPASPPGCAPCAPLHLDNFRGSGT